MKIFWLHDSSIHKNFHQNSSINDCARMILAYQWLIWPLRSKLHLMKNLLLHNVDILEKFLKDLALNKKYMAEKDDLMWTFMTSKVILYVVKNLRHHNVSIHRFLVRYRRSYVFNNDLLSIINIIKYDIL